MNDPKDLHFGTYIQRKPCGRMCIVLENRPAVERVLVRDTGFGSFWVTYKTLSKKWQCVGEKE